MKFSADTLDKMADCHLLKAVILIMEIENREVDGAKALGSMMRVSGSTLYNWEAGHGSPSIEQWVAVYEETKYEFVMDWLKHKINHKPK